MRSRTFGSDLSTSSTGARNRATAGGVVLVIVGVSTLLFAGQQAWAVGTTIDLGTSGDYSVLAGSAVTNTGPSVLADNLGVSPGTALTGFPPGIVGGVQHSADPQALQAQADLIAAYNDAAGQAFDVTLTAGDLGGLDLTAGVYKVDGATLLTGPLTLDGGNDPNSVFIFQIGSALTTGTDSSVILENGAQSCHVFWQIGSSATLGTRTAFVGTIMALTSVTLVTGATVEGRALARNGAVTLDTNTFTPATCAPPITPSATPTVPPVTPTSPPVTPTSPPITPTGPPVTPTGPPVTPTGSPVTPTGGPLAPTSSPTGTPGPRTLATTTTPTATSTAIPAVLPSGGSTGSSEGSGGPGSGSGDDSGTLASTGMDSSGKVPLIAVGLIALLGGFVLLIRARLRRIGR